MNLLAFTLLATLVSTCYGHGMITAGGFVTVWPSQSFALKFEGTFFTLEYTITSDNGNLNVLFMTEYEYNQMLLGNTPVVDSLLSCVNSAPCNLAQTTGWSASPSNVLYLETTNSVQSTDVTYSIKHNNMDLNCTFECPVSCSIDCPVTCSTDCPVTCSTDCPVTCSTDCPTNCTGDCPVQCASDCPVQCSSDCPVQCANDCPTNCTNDCPIDCAKDCPAVNSGSRLNTMFHGMKTPLKQLFC